MVPTDLTDFFLAASGVAGALIGLLFVAISVSQTRPGGLGESQSQRVRASAALAGFTNALAVSLFALIPGNKIGPTAVVVGVLGVLLVLGSLVSLARVGGLKRGQLGDVAFLVLLTATFVAQIVCGVQVLVDPFDAGTVRSIAVLVVVCFLVGIARAWELVGGSALGLGHQLGSMLGAKLRAHHASGATAPFAEANPVTPTDAG